MKDVTTSNNSHLVEEIFLTPSKTTIENRFAESQQAGCDGVHCQSGGGCVGFLEQ